MSRSLPKEYFCHICDSWDQSVQAVLGFLGSSDRILCHYYYSPPRHQEWTIIYWLQLLFPPNTKQVNEIMWSHPLSRDFIGLLALFYHNSTCDYSRWGSAHKLIIYFAVWLLTFKFLATSRCLLLQNINFSTCGVDKTPSFLIPQQPPEGNHLLTFAWESWMENSLL